jgi:hypothetical protein
MLRRKPVTEQGGLRRRDTPLWGSDSFNDGAGMARLITAANFVHFNMPRGTDYLNPQLTVEQAWDVAAYMVSQPRPTKSGPRQGFSRPSNQTRRCALRPVCRRIRSTATHVRTIWSDPRGARQRQRGDAPKVTPVDGPDRGLSSGVMVEFAERDSHLPGKIEKRYREGTEGNHEQDGHPALMLNL